MAADRRAAMRRAAIVRGAGFLALWLILAGIDVQDAPAAALAVVAATWASLHLLPPDGTRLSPLGIGRLALRFPGQAVAAGFDVAWRAFTPALPLRPGFVTFAPRLPPGTARDAFTAYASLLPGTLPTDTNADGTLLIHCLDTSQPVAAQLAAEEARFMRTFARPAGDA